MSSLVPFNRDQNFLTGRFHSMLDDFFNDFWTPSRSFRGETFKLDVKESEEAYTIEADLPGIGKEDINIGLNNAQLTISVAKKEEKETKNENYVHRERRYSSMSRGVYVPDAETKGISAKLEDGVLKVTVPKSKDKGGQNRIEIE